MIQYSTPRKTSGSDSSKSSMVSLISGWPAMKLAVLGMNSSAQSKTLIFVAPVSVTTVPGSRMGPIASRSSRSS